MESQVTETSTSYLGDSLPRILNVMYCAASFSSSGSSKAAVTINMFLRKGSGSKPYFRASSASSRMVLYSMFSSARRWFIKVALLRWIITERFFSLYKDKLSVDSI